MRNLELLIGACLLIMCLAAVMLGINYFRSREYVEPHIVVTGGGVDGYAVGAATLSLELYDDDIGWVTITSDQAGDAPIPTAYNPNTRVLTIAGLVESDTRELTITYRYGQLDSYWGSDLGSRVLPLLCLFGIIGLIGVAVYGFWPKGGGG